MKRLLTFLSVLLTLLCVGDAFAVTPSEAFVNAPRGVFPLLDRNTRLDMLDYYNSGLSTASKNVLNGNSAITAMTANDMKVKLTDASSVQLALLPSRSDSLIMVITTVMTPSPDSKLAVYTPNWGIVTEQSFKRPGLNDWLTAEGKKNRDQVEAFVPFLLISYDYDPASATLTLTNNTSDFLSEDVYTIVAPYLQPSLAYVWDGKRFNLKK